jgi:hypothetical protein
VAYYTGDRARDATETARRRASCECLKFFPGGQHPLLPMFSDPELPAGFIRAPLLPLPRLTPCQWPPLVTAWSRTSRNPEPLSFVLLCRVSFHPHPHDYPFQPNPPPPTPHLEVQLEAMAAGLAGARTTPAARVAALPRVCCKLTTPVGRRRVKCLS